MLKIAAGCLLGIAFGSAAAAVNYCISKRQLNSAKNRLGRSGFLSGMGTSALRTLVNVLALATVFFMRNILPFPFTAMAVGTALGLSVISFALLMRLARNSENEPD